MDAVEENVYTNNMNNLLKSEFTENPEGIKALHETARRVLKEAKGLEIKVKRLEILKSETAQSCAKAEVYREDKVVTY
jgi:hypothetical protein